MKQYPEELNAAVKDGDPPNFVAFVNSHKSKLAEWSMSLTHKTPIELHSYWKRQFVCSAREHGKELAATSQKTFDGEKWEQIVTLAKKLDQARTTYQIEAMDLLSASAPSSSAMLKNTLDIHDKQHQQDVTPCRAEWEGLDLEGLLHFLAYKKISGSKLDAMDKEFLSAVSNDGSVKSCLLHLAAQRLLLDTLNNNDMMCLKLLLSRIVNISNPTFKNLMTKHLEPDVLLSFEQACPNTYELDPAMADFISRIEAKKDDVDAILVLLCEEKLKYTKRKTSDMYACICCVEHIIDSLDLWKDDSASEATYYRRMATLFDHIFKYTDIKLVDGETGCSSTKTAIALNKTMFGAYDTAPAYPRKIDLLLKSQGLNQKDLVDICSNEFKKAAVSSSVVLAQQAKNMRINASILSKNGLLGVTDTMYFDVVGTDAYLFFLRYLPQHESYLGFLVTDVLHFPTNALFLDDLRNLISALFQFKQFVLDQEKVIRRAINKQQAKKRSAVIVDTTHLASSSDDQHSYRPGYIFFSPKAPPQKKARIDSDKENESRED